MMYNVLDRHRLLQFLSLGSDSMDVSDLEGGSADPSNGTENARKHIQSDPFLTEQCQGEVQAYVDIKNPEKIYESLNTKDCIDNQHEELMKVVKGVKTCISSLRRSLWILSRWSSLPTKRERDSKSKWLGLLAIQRVSPTEDCRTPQLAEHGRLGPGSLEDLQAAWLHIFFLDNTHDALCAQGVQSKLL